MRLREEAGGEAVRLERLWSGAFGDEYIERNRTAGEKRARFWRALLTNYPVRRVLEVGCNTGANLRWIAGVAPPEGVYGVDVNLKALGELRRALPQVHALLSPGRELPFCDGCFDLVFTVGVLIHQPDDTLPAVMAEIVRASRRYVLAGEYHAAELAEVPYRGQTGALFKRDYGRLYLEMFPRLAPRGGGFLGPADGFDDITWWLFEKQR